jgi:hypothetical protein
MMKEEYQFTQKELEYLKRGLKRSYKERFEMATLLYKIGLTMDKASITHKPFISKYLTVSIFDKAVIKIAFSLVLILCSGCTHSSKINIAIALTDSNKSLQISGFDKAVVNDIAQNGNEDAWQSLLPVYKMPADTDMKDFQTAQPGKYQLRDSLVIFTPDTTFKKGQLYFLRWYQYDKVGDALQYIRQKKKTGSISYKDLLFRY